MCFGELVEFGQKLGALSPTCLQFMLIDGNKCVCVGVCACRGVGVGYFTCMIVYRIVGNFRQANFFLKPVALYYCGKITGLYSCMPMD